MRHICQVILEIGATNVVQVISSNGCNCVSMGKILQEEFPKIVWTPCATHSLDFLIEDVGRLDWVGNIFSMATSMVNFVTKRPKVLSMYRANSDLKLLKPSKTSFAYMFIIVERLVRVRQSILCTMVCREWTTWDERGAPKSLTFSRMVMRDSWWQDAEGLVKALQPLYNVLRLTDMEGSTIGLLYEFMDKTGKDLNLCAPMTAERVQDIRGIWIRHWDWFHRPIPLHIYCTLSGGVEQYLNEELAEGWSDYITRLVDGDIQLMRKLEYKLLMYHNGRLNFGAPTV